LCDKVYYITFSCTLVYLMRQESTYTNLYKEMILPSIQNLNTLDLSFFLIYCSTLSNLLNVELRLTWISNIMI